MHVTPSANAFFVRFQQFSVSSFTCCDQYFPRMSCRQHFALPNGCAATAATAPPAIVAAPNCCRALLLLLLLLLLLFLLLLLHHLLLIQLLLLLLLLLLRMLLLRMLLLFLLRCLAESQIHPRKHLLQHRHTIIILRGRRRSRWWRWRR
jgi:hypothetical protein